jgi:hypothetical protein
MEKWVTPDPLNPTKFSTPRHGLDCGGIFYFTNTLNNEKISPHRLRPNQAPRPSPWLGYQFFHKTVAASGL